MAPIKSISQAASAVGVSEKTIQRAIEAGVIAREKDGRFDRRKLLAGIAARAAQRGGQPMGGSTGGMPSALIAIKQQQAQEELELTRAKRMRAQQELAEMSGQLILKSDALRGWCELMMNFRDALLALGDQIALRCDMRKAREISVIIRGAHEEVLKQLAEGGERFNGSLGVKGGAR